MQSSNSLDSQSYQLEPAHLELFLGRALGTLPLHLQTELGDLALLEAVLDPVVILRSTYPSLFRA